MNLIKKNILLGVLAGLLPLVSAQAQVLSNSTLNGKYYFRHLQFTTDTTGAVTQAGSLAGFMVFNGQGAFTFQGQLTIGAASAGTSSGGSGTYQVQSNGFASITNPQRSDLVLNARLGANALVGSSTEAAGTVTDLFIAIPAPTSPVSTGAVTGTYQVAVFGMPSGIPSQVRNALFRWDSSGQGTINPISVVGLAANLGSQVITQTISGATYTISADGSGTANFPIPPGSTPASVLLGGTENIFVSSDGSLMIGGSAAAGGQDILVAVKALSGTAANSSLQGIFYTAGLTFGSHGLSSFAGSANSSGNGSILFTQRLHSASGNLDSTGVDIYLLNSDGTGTSGLLRLAVGASGSVILSSDINSLAVGNYGIDIGILAKTFTGSGVFVNPAGIVNAASFAPVGAPLAPGELFSIFGAGLAAQTAWAQGFPLPLQIAGVQVLVNNNAVPMVAVSPGQVNALMPAAITGAQAAVVVNNNGRLSNSVNIPLAKTAPGVFSADFSGIGAGAILHSDFSLVNASSPARRGETVLIYLTGLGVTSPAVGDGLAAPSNPLSLVNASVTATIGGKVAAVGFKGLAPGFAALYQLNVTVPSDAPSGSNIAVTISTTEATNNQVTIAIQ